MFLPLCSIILVLSLQLQAQNLYFSDDCILLRAPIKRFGGSPPVNCSTTRSLIFFYFIQLCHTLRTFSLLRRLPCRSWAIIMVPFFESSRNLLTRAVVATTTEHLLIVYLALNCQFVQTYCRWTNVCLIVLEQALLTTRPLDRLRICMKTVTSNTWILGKLVNIYRDNQLHWSLFVNHSDRKIPKIETRTSCGRMNRFQYHKRFFQPNICVLGSFSKIGNFLAVSKNPNCASINCIQAISISVFGSLIVINVSASNHIKFWYISKNCIKALLAGLFNDASTDVDLARVFFVT